jgi:ABC-type transporter Mla MlaB component
MEGLAAAAREYVREGLEREERVAFCRLSPLGSRVALVSDVAQVGVPPTADVPVLTPLATDPDWRPSRDPVTTLGPMTDAALADGYTGLRLFTDATDLARDPEARGHWLRSEHLIDRYSVDHPLTVLCAYDVEAVGPEAVAKLACVHALTGGRPCSFLLHARRGGGLALTGEVDRSSAVALYQAVVRIAAGRAGPVVLDLSEHDFIDHTGLVALHRAARALGKPVHLVGASRLTTLLVDAFALTGVRVLEES